ncbi:unnamed protein product [Rhizophagus irregularis]|uniref:Uncharacterized protein n=1 Tax=Rhizophagus irregularis TaxID=588596 RepID=A0A915ZVQ6_9GLOM|nr:unnamed protein product [Rhizophagus irregularis]CAB5215530.1 unnamed protein product [Rhizophagus irregularis]CAB5389049.1 unnamed protein product [Rhizophagus irregularis]
MSDRSLPQRFRLPLPKPINDVIPCQQQTLNLHPAGKPMPNRRGRKPLATMPLGKKRVQNLTNKEHFVNVKENYIRNLKLRALDLEVLYNSAQDEIKTLNDRIAMLEKRLATCFFQVDKKRNYKEC